MTTIYLVTTDQLLAVAMKPKVASGDVESTRLHVEFDAEWDLYNIRTAVFFTSYSDTVYGQVLTDGECTIPHEVLTKGGILYIGVRGTNSNAAVKTSTLVKYKIEEGAPVVDGTAEPPTPSVYQQILNIVASAEQSAQDAEDIAQSVRDDAEAGVFNGITPHIGENKNWWIGDTDTGIKAEATVNVEGLSHKHSTSDISDFPTSMTPTAHKHATSDITDFPTVPSKTEALTFTFKDGTTATIEVYVK